MHHRLTPIEAARFGKSIEDYRMFWMEDPTPAENQECFRLIRQHTVTPIAVGEVFNSIWDCKQLIERATHRLYPHHADPCRRNYRYAPDCRFCFVVSGLYWLPGRFRFVTSLHGCGAALICGSPISVSGEYMGYSEQMLEVFPHNWTFDNGYMHPGDKPGLGIEFDEKLAAKYL
ncbi:enolase C-terminal domain-like protein [Escherichia coli]|uniref:enolase C-terminal domain-like protein n=1 Tax=Escherichia coli TaxID=562 RepID=UPI0022389AEF|nr:enolase C-terminal domain-like protein [Escherichia coli]MCW7160608.1 hypothetical protein [Escherichia coli]